MTQAAAIAKGSVAPKPAESPLLVSWRRTGGLPVIGLRGALDAQSCAAFLDQMRRQIAGLQSDLVVDLTGLAALDPAGLQALVDLDHVLAPGGGRLLLDCSTPQAHRIFDLACVFDHLTADQKSARQHLAEPCPGPCELTARRIVGDRQGMTARPTGRPGSVTSSTPRRHTPMLIDLIRRAGISSDVAQLAAVASIGASIAAWGASRTQEDASAAKAERWGIFVGLWAPTFFGLANALKADEESSAH